MITQVLVKLCSHTDHSRSNHRSGQNGITSIDNNLTIQQVKQQCMLLFVNLAEHYQDAISDFNSQDINNILWAYATLGASHAQLHTFLTSLSRQAITICQSFKPQELVNTTTCSFIKLEPKKESGFQTLDQAEVH